MPLVKPILDLRNKTNRISKLVHESDEPIFITKNGEGELVVMSMAQDGKMQLKIELFSKLAGFRTITTSSDWDIDFS